VIFGAEPLGTWPLGAGSGFAGAPAELPPSGKAVLPIRVSVVPAAVASGSATVADGGARAAVWGALVEVGGVDVSDLVVGEIVIEGEESAARVADFSMHLVPGTVVSPAEWTGKAVRVSLVDMASGVPASPMLLFSGVIDLPDISPSSGLLALRCTDNRQGVIGGMTKAQIDALLVNSRWSSAVFSAGASPWVYANDRISTIPAALDLAPNGALRLTPWMAKETADLSFDADQIIDESISVDFAERGALTNLVNVNFGYRFPRVKAEGYAVSYDYLALNATSFVYWVRDNNMFLQRAAVESAISQAGGSIVSITYIPLPTTAQIIPGTGGEPAGAWLPNPSTDPLSCLGFSAVVSFDYAQTIEETHKIVVSNARSIDAVGVVRSEMSGALEGVYDDATAVEQNILLYREKVTTIPPKNLAAVIEGVTNAVNCSLTADSDRAAANAAMACLIAVAGTEIYASHRQHMVQATVPCNPVLDVDKTVAVSAGGVSAKGKVKRVRHRLSPDEGSAISEFSLAICSVAGVGITHAADAVTAPAGTSAGPTNTLAAPTVAWNGMAGGDNVITITFPGVEEAERAKAAHTISTAYAAPLYEDLLEVAL
jgi:hypothetical protein